MIAEENTQRRCIVYWLACRHEVYLVLCISESVPCSNGAP